MKTREGVAMAVENWFFGRAARKIIFEGRWPSEIRAVLRTMMKVREGVARPGGIMCQGTLVLATPAKNE